MALRACQVPDSRLEQDQGFLGGADNLSCPPAPRKGACHPSLPPPTVAPPHLPCRGHFGGLGLQGDEVRARAGVWQLSPVALQKGVQDAGLVDADQGSQVLSLVQLGGVGLQTSDRVSSGFFRPYPTSTTMCAQMCICTNGCTLALVHACAHTLLGLVI